MSSKSSDGRVGLSARAFLLVLALGVAMLLTAVTLHAQATPQSTRSEQCVALPSADGRPLVARAVDATGVRAGVDRSPVLRYTFSDAVSQNYQSDRMYPPYLSFNWDGTVVIDRATGVQRVDERMFGAGSRGPQLTLLTSERGSYVARDTALLPFAQWHATTLRSRPLDVWSMLIDWSASSDVRVVARCVYRDYPRMVLERVGRMGRERLYLDPKSGLPVKLDRIETDGLRGDVHVEYVYSNWKLLDGHSALVASATFRLVDGDAEITRTTADFTLVGSDSMPRVALPSAVAEMPAKVGSFPAPDTVRVGEHTFLLVNRAYTNVVTLQRDTVFVLDAQLGEERARQDSLWISRLFPGKHPTVLVVTDLAWPHIAGVRTWVANETPVISHRASREFLSQVVSRRWTLAPDLLEKRRGTKMKLRTVNDSLVLAGGGIRLYAIDGIGSEGALMAYLPGDRFLYAGDYVQTVREPSAYASEVASAVARVGITPERVAAMHLPLTSWSTVTALSRPGGASPADVK